jgi:soluble cytochrome b562
VERSYAAEQRRTAVEEGECMQMNERDLSRVYVRMMVDSLRQKKRILLALQKATKEQEQMFHQEKLDADHFQELIDEKGRQIDELTKLDEGFDNLFRRIKGEVTEHKEDYKEEIQEMQQLISDLSDLSVSIQALESQNSQHFKVYLAGQRKEIRNFHVNQRTASSYYQNMANIHRQEQSYFLNETK